MKIQRAYYLNMKLYNDYNKIEEKNKEYENFIQNEKKNNEKLKKAREIIEE